MKSLYSLKRIVLIVSLFILFMHSAASSNGIDSTFSAILQNKLHELKGTYNLVGISAAALVPGIGLWTGASGKSSNTVDVNPEMVFGAGSITKNFVAAIILQLSEFDSLELDDSLGTWLPHYDNIDGAITIRQLLGHTSGIYNYTNNSAFHAAVNQNLNRLWQPEEILTSGFVLAPNFLPGTSWGYSNTNFLLLGLIIKQIMGTTLSEELHERIFEPLYLDESFLETQDTIKLTYAHNWVDLNGDGILDDADFLPRTAIYSCALSAGAIITRPENLVRWQYALYNGKILSKNSISEMLIFRPANISGANGYGLGTMRYDVGGRICYGHGGNIFGFTSAMIYDSIDNISIAIMTNRDLNGGPIAKSFMSTVIQNNPVGVTSVSSGIPAGYNLYQNYPNPFNPSTNIRFDLPENGFVRLSVFDVLGKEIEILYSGNLKAGTHKYSWNGSGISSGVYFYKLHTESYSAINKMVLTK